MKKLLILLSIIIIYIGCKKDESISPTDYQINEYSEGILGHWKLDQTRRNIKSKIKNEFAL